MPASRKSTPSGPTRPRHVAIVMDGNGRWAQQRRRPRAYGHQSGVKNAQRIAEACADRGIQALTLFAFSSENWKRPRSEVERLMELFARSLEREVEALHDNGIRLQFIGALDGFGADLRAGMEAAQARTAHNTRMRVAVAMNYGGRWDIVAAARRLLREGADAEGVDEARFGAAVSLADFPEPDLFIRTGGERRISNFLLWQIAYTELYFTDTLWPDFDAAALDGALEDFRSRQRRFGRTSDQLMGGNHA